MAGQGEDMDTAGRTATGQNGRTNQAGRDVCPARASLRAVGLVLALFSCLALTVLLACGVGSYPAPPGEVLRALAQAAGLAWGAPVDQSLSVVIVDIRLARVLLAGLTGAALALAGAAFQGVLRNPLADSFTLGVSGGAAFGASLAIISGLAGQAALTGDSRALPACALAGALGALILVLGLSRAGGGPLSGLRRETVVLAGIVVSTFLSALISLLKSLDEESVSSIVFWIMGSFQGRGFEHAQLAWPYMLVGAVVILWRARELDLLALGESQARMLGLDAGRSRLWLLLGASLLSGAAVAVSGVIGFVGLVVPHLVRLALGAGHARLLPASALLGALLLIWSDVAARSALPGGAELPVGVVTALIGGPFFCLILARKGLKRGENP
ncbi:iron ABC transporter permease [Humidesulfovibrio sp.]|uniref:FecCD family ABC transporter permease n=1 Tax=Humidesulfovibrio sp. TaxID=2910988 RepID=UPI002D8076E4|nr:iron ABC transporter permease [Humidesulfovibrio sp.]